MINRKAQKSYFAYMPKKMLTEFGFSLGNDAGDLVLVLRANNNYILTFFFLNTDEVY